MQQPVSKIEAIIREQTGLGPLTANQGAYLKVFVRAIFRTKSSVMVMYMNKKQMTIYLMPTNEPNEDRPSYSEPMSVEDYNLYKHVAQECLDKLLTKTKDFSGLSLFYKFKIVREIPKTVKKSEKIPPWQSNQ